MQRREAVANGIGLSVLAVEIILGLVLMSRLACPGCAYPDAALRWSGLALVFLISYSVVSLAAIYLWKRNRFSPANWLAFIAFCGVLVLLIPTWKGWYRGGAAIGVVIGISSLARSLAMQSMWAPPQPSHSACDR